MSKTLVFLYILITYGSLYPFSFNLSADISSQLIKVFDFNPLSSSFSDLIANVLLFIPIGLVYKPAKPNVLDYIVFTSCIFLFAFFIQVLQIWSQSRIPAGSDALWNVAGLLLGYSLSAVFSGHFATLSSEIAKSKAVNKIPMVLLFGFILVDLFPLAPTLALDSIKSNVLNLLNPDKLSVLSIVKLFSYYTLTLYFATEVMGNKRRVLEFSVLLIPFLLSQVFIMDSQCNINALIAVLLAIIVSLNVKKDTMQKSTLFFIYTLIITNGLGTFTYSGASPSLNMVPFAPALSSNTLVNILAFVEKGLYYTTFTFLALQRGYPLFKILGKLFVMVLILELLQVSIAKSTADITEVIVAIIVVIFTAKWIAESYSNEHVKQQIHLLKSRCKQQLLSKSLLITIVILIAGISCQFIIMAAPNLPYNIKELYVNNGNLLSYTFTTIAALWFGTGLYLTSENNHPLLANPFGMNTIAAKVTLVSGVFYLVLRLGITGESIADISGSSNLKWQLTGDEILGQFGIKLVEVFGDQKVWNFSQILEPIIRFSFLLSPLALSITAFLTYANAFNSADVQVRKKLLRYLPANAAFFVCWLFLYKLVTFDFSSTDNLNELIARDNQYGIGGGLYLYILMALTAAVVSSAFAGAVLKKIKLSLFSAVLFAFSTSCSWWLVQKALVTEFSKYGYTFSGVDFLIGGSRSNLLPQSELEFRWLAFFMVVNLSLIIVLFVGRTIATSIQVRLSESESTAQNSNPSCEPASSLETDISPTAKEEAVNKPSTRSFMPHKRLHLIIPSCLLAIGLLTYLYLTGQLINQQVISPRHLSWAGNDATLIFDHHMHSTFSDGSLPISTLVDKSVESGCNVIAITDHTDSKFSFNKDRFNDIKLARIFNDDIFIINGLELNVPSYGKREHVNILLHPNVEQSFFENLSYVTLSDEPLREDNSLFAFIGKQNNGYPLDILAIYNHPSRQAASAKEILKNYRSWTNENELFIGFSGAPGHQKSTIPGNYQRPENIENRWDTAVTKAGGVLDQLLDEGREVFGAIAASDYHNESMDYLPCSFAKTHLIADSASYDAIFNALKYGTFWSSHGNFISQYKFNVETDKTTKKLSPGETGIASEGDIALVTFEFERTREHINSQLEVNIYSNCPTGQPKLLDSLLISEYEEAATALIPIGSSGRDGRSCYIRSRVKTSINNEFYMAFSNHVRIFIE